LKTFHHPLLRVALAAALATVITWLGGLLFGPVSDARARQLAQSMSATAQRSVEATASSIVRSEARGRPALPFGVAA